MAVPVILRGQGSSLAVTLPADGDYAGATIRLEVCGLVFEWPSPAPGATLRATILSDDTARLPLGAHFGRLTAALPAGGAVVSETVRIVVTDDAEAANGAEYAIDVSGGGGFHPDLSGIDADPATPNELRAAFQTLLRRLREAAGAGVALAMLLAGTALADGRVVPQVVPQVVALGDLPWDAPVVTNVVVDGELGLGAEAVTNIAEAVVVAATEGFLRVESDPLFAAWAGGPDGTNGLAELAAEVSANSALLDDHDGRLGEAEQYIQDVANQIPDLSNYYGDINTGGHITAGSMDIQGSPVVAADDIGTAAYRDEDYFATRADEQLLAQLVMGSNVVFEVTNYNSRAHAPAARILQLSESNEYYQVWAETNGLARTLDAATAYADGATNALDRAKADRAWSRHTSGLGASAPSNTTWISTPTTVVAGGYEYAKVVRSGGESWVLCSNGMGLGADTNGYIRIETGDGEPLVSIERTESVLVGVDAAGITCQGNTVTIPVPVVSQDPPVCYATRELASPTTWSDLIESSPDWIDSAACTGSSGSWVWTITTDAPSGFFQFRVLQPGATVIRNHGWTDLSGGIIVNGVRYAPSASGDTLTFTRVSGQ